MPRFNKTGPDGNGPRTGRKMGNCNLNQKDIENKLENSANDSTDSASEILFKDKSTNNRKHRNKNR
ncbi:MAG: DUF5320 domain-containing protein [Bacilli bacterium]|nr:DUF5320 domain-containing protein [Bacilli bacterium]